MISSSANRDSFHALNPNSNLNDNPTYIYIYMLFEMDVLQRSRSSYNPTVSFRVYAIRVCSPRGVLTGPPLGRSPPLLGYPGSPHGGASVARPKMAPALPLTSLSHTALSIVSLAFIPASSPISCVPTHSGALETSLSCTFRPNSLIYPDISVMPTERRTRVRSACRHHLDSTGT